MESITEQPLVPVSNDVNDFKALILNHFIIGSDCYSFSPGIFKKPEINLCQKRCLAQATANLFWDRWKQEYLSTLNVCRKWTGQYQNFRVEDLAIISTKDLPCSYWPMGYITELYPGPDGVACSVKLKTKKEEFKQPSALLYLLKGVEWW